jgi:DNA invertase Pin-like site-specific DNA recombinase
VLGLTERGVHVVFVKENLTFTGEDSPMSNLLLSVMGAFTQFERELIRERQREGIAIAKREGKYGGRKPSLTNERAVELRRRVSQGGSKAALAREFGISRDRLYRYAICFATNRRVLSLKSRLRGTSWAARLPLVTAMLGLSPILD